MNQLPVQRASELSIDSASLTQWLVQGLWSDQAVGILGGEPKCCKSFLALDLAVSVASGTPCLRRFAVRYDPQRPSVLECGGCEGRSTAPLHSRSVRGVELNCRSSTQIFCLD
jgi:hypothetical protein